MSMKISTIWNRTRDLPTFSAVPQPAAPPRTPTLQVIHSKCSRIVGNYPRPTPRFPPAQNCNNEPIRDIIHRLTARIFAHCPFTCEPPSPTNRELYSSRLANMHRKYKRKCTEHILSLPEVVVFYFLFFHFRYLHLYLYSFPFRWCHSVNIYSNWFNEQFCILLLYMLYIQGYS
jgi:hypothetical protein